MANNILLISGESGFMMLAIIRNLGDSNIYAELMEPSAEKLDQAMSGLDNDIHMILMYAGEYINDSEELFGIIKGLCEEQDVLFSVIGYRRDFDRIKELIPVRCITDEIERPFAMHELVKRIKKHFFDNASRTDESVNKRKSLLLVDDDMPFLKMMEKWLSEYYDVTIVKSGTQAITFLATNSPDLILLDFNMPVLSGPQVMQAIRTESNCPNVPIIFLTGRSDKESVMEVMALKPQGYILKASPQSDILKTIQNFFAKHSYKT